MKTLSVLTVTASIIALSITGVVSSYQQRKLEAMQENLTVTQGHLAALQRDFSTANKKLEDINKALQPKPPIKESAMNLRSGLQGNVSTYSVQPAKDATGPQFKKLTAFMTAIDSFSEAAMARVVSITPVGPCEMIDGEPAYTMVIVTHAR